MNIIKKLRDFMIKPSGIALIFVLVMLVPNVVLAITEPYSFTAVAASLLLPAGFYLLWVLLRPNPGVMILWGIPLMILCAFQLVISYMFSGSIIAVDMFTNLFTTNVSEAGELLASIYPAVIIVIVLYVPLIVLGIIAVRKKIRMNRRRSAVMAGLVLLAVGTGFACASKMRNPDFGVRYHIFPVNVCYNIKLSCERWTRSLQYPETSADFRFDAVKTRRSNRREIYVYVIGEASRACSWSLFGYERETTPLLEVRRGIVPFRDVLTQNNTTHKSVPILLAPASAENFEEIYTQKSIVTLFGEAGFRTAFISNQPPNRSLIDYFAAEANILCDVTPHSGLTWENRLDGDILPVLDSVINSTDRNLFVVVHTYGSHSDHIKRYPRSFARFTPDVPGSVSRNWLKQIRNGYDNTIAYTDYVLSEIISMLDDADVCSALLYCSDHGEDILDDDRNRYLHASPTTTYYQLHVAAFAWFSDNYASEYPDIPLLAAANTGAPVTTAAMFGTMVDMASISTPHADPQNSLVNPRRRDMPRMYINDYNKAVGILESGLTDIDIRMFDRHHIKYDPADLPEKKI